MPDFDILFAGGGLASCLAALRLASTRPEVRVGIVERGSRLGGRHIWSSFATDLTAEQRAWTAPLVAHRWPSYAVMFPRLVRRLATGYSSVTSESLDAAVRAALPADALVMGAEVAALSPTTATLADGRTITAAAVIDGRGPRDSAKLDLRWQKFVGRVVDLEADHGLTEPLVMDACVPQLDGYRFVYVLPFSPRRLLIEDTYYSDSPALDRPELGDRIASYAARRGWAIAEVLSEEGGVLPVALGGDIDAFWAEAPAGVPQIGLRAALFHPTTGYSFADAVRTAELIAGLPALDPATIEKAVRGASRAAWKARNFYRMLNRMLFLAAAPDERYRVLQRFYGLNEGLVGRFYAARSTVLDRLRVVSGVPPVPLLAGVRAAFA